MATRADRDLLVPRLGAVVLVEPKMQLAKMQELFWKSMRSAHPPPELSEQFVGRGKLDAVARIAIYRSMYWSRQTAALRETFPRLRSLLGDEQFTKLTRAYVLEHPSQQPALEHLGGNLAAFLCATSNRWKSHTSALAALEWARVAALLAPDPPRILDVSCIEPSRFAECRVELIASLRLLKLPQLVLSLWRADNAAQPDADSDGTNDEVSIAVWRRDCEVLHVSLSEIEARAITMAHERRTMAEVCTTLAGEHACVESAQRILGTWFSRNWIVNLTPEPA